MGNGIGDPYSSIPAGRSKRFPASTAGEWRIIHSDINGKKGRIIQNAVINTARQDLSKAKLSRRTVVKTIKPKMTESSLSRITKVLAKMNRKMSVSTKN